AKLNSTLSQRYPGRRLEVIVVSDGSTDVTDAVVASYPDPRVRLVRQEPRAGKSPALNRGALAARGDVLVFTDANALFAPEALARLAAPFADPRVGLVSGQGLYGGLDGDARVVSSGYVRYEAALKSGESALGFLASADGAIYALRRDLYRWLALGAGARSGCCSPTACCAGSTRRRCSRCSAPASPCSRSPRSIASPWPGRWRSTRWRWPAGSASAPAAAWAGWPSPTTSAWSARPASRASRASCAAGPRRCGRRRARWRSAPRERPP